MGRAELRRAKPRAGHRRLHPEAVAVHAGAGAFVIAQPVGGIKVGAGPDLEDLSHFSSVSP